MPQQGPSTPSLVSWFLVLAVLGWLIVILTAIPVARRWLGQGK
jgi:hypothetical protein